MQVVHTMDGHASVNSAYTCSICCIKRAELILIALRNGSVTNWGLALFEMYFMPQTYLKYELTLQKTKCGFKKIEKNYYPLKKRQNKTKSSVHCRCLFSSKNYSYSE